MKELICKFVSYIFYIILNAIFVDRSSVAIIVPSASVDEIELFFKDTVVESFGVDAHISFCLNTWGKGSSQF